ncbi:toxin glutamine deamidase domain-containing protein, partial [Micromonospora qiuiae]|uniref:toxin glutamine deamidase domain-containing protein n=1 Tax=Micromonospora qiuiae TaxID=502268 RepID=UPI001EF3679C
MPLEVPDSAAGFFKWFYGEEFPGLLPEKIAAFGFTLGAVSGGLERAGGELRAGARRIRGGVEGSAGRAFADAVAGVERSLRVGPEFLRTASELMLKFAATLLYVQVTILAITALLLFELLVALKLFWINPSLLAQWVAKGPVVRQAIFQLLSRTASRSGMDAIFNMVYELLVDVVAQLASRGRKYQRGWDRAATADAAKSAAWEVLFEQVYARGRGGVRRFAGPAVDRMRRVPAGSDAADTVVGTAGRAVDRGLAEGSIEALVMLAMTGRVDMSALHGGVAGALNSVSFDAVRKVRDRVGPSHPDNSTTANPAPTAGWTPTAGNSAPTAEGPIPVGGPIPAGDPASVAGGSAPMPAAVTTSVTSTGLSSPDSPAISTTAVGSSAAGGSGGSTASPVVVDAAVGSRPVPRVVHLVVAETGRLGAEDRARVTAWVEHARAAGWDTTVWLGPEAVEANPDLVAGSLSGHAVTVGRLDDLVAGPFTPRAAAVVSEIARLAVLDRVGGMAVDPTRVPPDGVRLPEAPLLVTGPAGVPYLGPVTSDLAQPIPHTAGSRPDVIAAPPGSQFLRQVRAQLPPLAALHTLNPDELDTVTQALAHGQHITRVLDQHPPQDSPRIQDNRTTNPAETPDRPAGQDRDATESPVEQSPETIAGMSHDELSAVVAPSDRPAEVPPLWPVPARWRGVAGRRRQLVPWVGDGSRSAFGQAGRLTPGHRRPLRPPVPADRARTRRNVRAGWTQNLGLSSGLPGDDLATRQLFGPIPRQVTTVFMYRGPAPASTPVRGTIRAAAERNPENLRPVNMPPIPGDVQRWLVSRLMRFLNFTQNPPLQPSPLSWRVTDSDGFPRIDAQGHPLVRRIGLSFKPPRQEDVASLWSTTIFDGRYSLEIVPGGDSSGRAERAIQYVTRRLPFPIDERTFFIDGHSNQYDFFVATTNRPSQGLVLRGYRAVTGGQLAQLVLESPHYQAAVNTHGDELRVVLATCIALPNAAEFAEALGRSVWATNGVFMVGRLGERYGIGLRMREGEPEPAFYFVDQSGRLFLPNDVSEEEFERRAASLDNGLRRRSTEYQRLRANRNMPGPTIRIDEIDLPTETDSFDAFDLPTPLSSTSVIVPPAGPHVAVASPSDTSFAPQLSPLPPVSPLALDFPRRPSWGQASSSSSSSSSSAAQPTWHPSQIDASEQTGSASPAGRLAPSFPGGQRTAGAGSNPFTGMVRTDDAMINGLRAALQDARAQGDDSLAEQLEKQLATYPEATSGPQHPSQDGRRSQDNDTTSPAETLNQHNPTGVPPLWPVPTRWRAVAAGRRQLLPWIVDGSRNAFGQTARLTPPRRRPLRPAVPADRARMRRNVRAGWTQNLGLSSGLPGDDLAARQLFGPIPRQVTTVFMYRGPAPTSTPMHVSPSVRAAVEAIYNAYAQQNLRVAAESREILTNVLQETEGRGQHDIRDVGMLLLYAFVPVERDGQTEFVPMSLTDLRKIFSFSSDFVEKLADRPQIFPLAVFDPVAIGELFDNYPNVLDKLVERMSGDGWLYFTPGESRPLSFLFEGQRQLLGQLEHNGFLRNLYLYPGRLSALRNLGHYWSFAIDVMPDEGLARLFHHPVVGPELGKVITARSKDEARTFYNRLRFGYSLTSALLERIDHSDDVRDDEGTWRRKEYEFLADNPAIFSISQRYPVSVQAIVAIPGMAREVVNDEKLAAALNQGYIAELLAENPQLGKRLITMGLLNDAVRNPLVAELLSLNIAHFDNFSDEDLPGQIRERTRQDMGAPQQPSMLQRLVAKDENARWVTAALEAHPVLDTLIQAELRRKDLRTLNALRNSKGFNRAKFLAENPALLDQPHEYRWWLRGVTDASWWEKIAALAPEPRKRVLPLILRNFDALGAKLLDESHQKGVGANPGPRWARLIADDPRRAEAVRRSGALRTAIASGFSLVAETVLEAHVLDAIERDEKILAITRFEDFAWYQELKDDPKLVELLAADSGPLVDLLSKVEHLRNYLMSRGRGRHETLRTYAELLNDWTRADPTSYSYSDWEAIVENPSLLSYFSSKPDLFALLAEHPDLLHVLVRKDLPSTDEEFRSWLDGPFTTSVQLRSAGDTRWLEPMWRALEERETLRSPEGLDVRGRTHFLKILRDSDDDQAVELVHRLVELDELAGEPRAARVDELLQLRQKVRDHDRINALARTSDELVMALLKEPNLLEVLLLRPRLLDLMAAPYGIAPLLHDMPALFLAMRDSYHLYITFVEDPSLRDQLHRPDIAPLVAKNPFWILVRSTRRDMLSALASSEASRALLWASPAVVAAVLTHDQAVWHAGLSDQGFVRALLDREEWVRAAALSALPLTSLLARNTREAASTVGESASMLDRLESAPAVAEALRDHRHSLSESEYESFFEGGLFEQLRMHPSYAAKAFSSPDALRLLIAVPNLSALIDERPNLLDVVVASSALRNLVSGNPSLADYFRQEPAVWLSLLAPLRQRAWSALLSFLNSAPGNVELLGRNPGLVSALARSRAVLGVVQNETLRPVLAANPDLTAVLNSRRVRALINAEAAFATVRTVPVLDQSTWPIVLDDPELLSLIRSDSGFGRTLFTDEAMVQLYLRHRKDGFVRVARSLVGGPRLSVQDLARELEAREPAGEPSAGATPPSRSPAPTVEVAAKESAPPQQPPGTKSALEEQYAEPDAQELLQVVARNTQLRDAFVAHAEIPWVLILWPELKDELDVDPERINTISFHHFLDTSEQREQHSFVSAFHGWMESIGLALPAEELGLRDAARVTWEQVQRARHEALSRAEEDVRKRFGKLNPSNPATWEVSDEILYGNGYDASMFSSDELKVLEAARQGEGIRESGIRLNHAAHTHGAARGLGEVKGISMTWVLLADGRVALKVYGVSKSRSANNYRWEGASKSFVKGPLEIGVIADDPDLTRSVQLLRDRHRVAMAPAVPNPHPRPVDREENVRRTLVESLSETTSGTKKKKKKKKKGATAAVDDRALSAPPGGESGGLAWWRPDGVDHASPERLLALFDQRFGWISQVNDGGGERTAAVEGDDGWLANCLPAAYAVYLTLADGRQTFVAPPVGRGEGSRPGDEDARGLPTADLVAFANDSRDGVGAGAEPRTLVEVDGFGPVAAAVGAAGRGAQGLVVVSEPGQGTGHVFNVVADDDGVVFLDGQAGRPARLPANGTRIFFIAAGPVDVTVPGTPVTIEGAVTRLAGPATDSSKAIAERLKPLLNHVGAGAEPEPGADLIVMSDERDRVWVEVRVPGRVEPVSLGSSPTSSVLDPSARVLAAVPIDVSRLRDAVDFSRENSELWSRSLQGDASEFVRKFSSKAVGSAIVRLTHKASAGEFIRTMLEQSSRTWADGENPVTVLDEQDRILLAAAEASLTSDPDRARVQRVRSEARVEVALTHQRPQASITGTQLAQLNLLESFATMMAAAEISQNRGAAREVSQRLGQKYGTLRGFQLPRQPPQSDTNAPQQSVETFLEMTRPLQDHAREHLDDPTNNIELVLMAAPPRVFAHDVPFSPGHAVVTFSLPNGRQVTLGFYPDRGLFGAQGKIGDDTSYIAAPHVRVLAAYNIDAKQLERAYRYVAKRFESDYHLLKSNCVVFAVDTIAAALGRPLSDRKITTPKDLIDTLSSKSNWAWADGSSKERVHLREPHREELASAQRLLDLVGKRTERYDEIFGRAKLRVAVDHQRPLVTHWITPRQTSQLEMLEAFTTMVAAELHVSGEIRAAQLSRELGLAYGTLRHPDTGGDPAVFEVPEQSDPLRSPRLVEEQGLSVTGPLATTRPAPLSLMQGVLDAPGEAIFSATGEFHSPAAGAGRSSAGVGSSYPADPAFDQGGGTEWGDRRVGRGDSVFVQEIAGNASAADIGSWFPWLSRVNPGLPEGDHEEPFGTNCVIAAIATAISLREGEGYQASGTEALPAEYLLNYQRQQLGLADDAPGLVWRVPDIDAVRDAFEAAEVGAQGLVVVRARVPSASGFVTHVFNGVRHSLGGSLLLDGQLGGPARMPVPNDVISIDFLPLTPGVPIPVGSQRASGLEGEATGWGPLKPDEVDDIVRKETDHALALLSGTYNTVKAEAREQWQLISAVVNQSDLLQRRNIAAGASWTLPGMRRLAGLLVHPDPDIRRATEQTLSQLLPTELLADGWFDRVLNDARINRFVEEFALLHPAGTAPSPARTGRQNQVLDQRFVEMFRYALARSSDGVDRTSKDRFVGLLGLLTSVSHELRHEAPELAGDLHAVADAVASYDSTLAETSRLVDLVNWASVRKLSDLLGEALNHPDVLSAPADGSDGLSQSLRIALTALTYLHVPFHETGVISDTARRHRFEQALSDAHERLQRTTDPYYVQLRESVQEVWGLLQVLRSGALTQTGRRGRRKGPTEEGSGHHPAPTPVTAPQALPTGSRAEVAPWEGDQASPSETAADAIGPAQPVSGGRKDTARRNPARSLFIHVLHRIAGSFSGERPETRPRVQQTVTVFDDDGNVQWSQDDASEPPAFNEYVSADAPFANIIERSARPVLGLADLRRGYPASPGNPYVGMGNRQLVEPRRDVQAWARASLGVLPYHPVGSIWDAASVEMYRRLADVTSLLPQWDRITPDCPSRVDAVLTGLALSAVARDDAMDDVDVVARRLGGVFGRAALGGLVALGPGSVTVVRVDRPNMPRHLVLVARLPNGRLVLIETQAEPGRRLVGFELPEPNMPGSTLPAVLRGPVQLVLDGSGRLRQVDLTDVDGPVARVSRDAVDGSLVDVLLEAPSTRWTGMATHDAPGGPSGVDQSRLRVVEAGGAGWCLLNSAILSAPDAFSALVASTAAEESRWLAGVSDRLAKPGGVDAVVVDPSLGRAATAVVERVAALLRTSSDPTLGRVAILNHRHQMAHGQGWQTDFDSDVSHDERMALADSVANWESTWASAYGDDYPHLLADVVGRPLVVGSADPDGNTRTHVYEGTRTGTPIHVWRQGPAHYQAWIPAEGTFDRPELSYAGVGLFIVDEENSVGKVFVDVSGEMKWRTTASVGNVVVLRALLTAQGKPVSKKQLDIALRARQSKTVARGAVGHLKEWLESSFGAGVSGKVFRA